MTQSEYEERLTGAILDEVDLSLAPPGTADDIAEEIAQEIAEDIAEEMARTARLSVPAERIDP